MRVSTNTLYDQGTRSMLQQQGDLFRLQQQLSSGKRIMVPSDDPIGAARAHELTQSLSLNTQYATNRHHAMDNLQQVDSTLGAVTDVIQNVRVLTVAAGNPVYSDNERMIMATELRDHFEQLLGLANTQDEQGNYLFSGFKGDTPAFKRLDDDPTKDGFLKLAYQGDDGKQLIQISASRQLPVSVTGKDVFVFGENGENLFDTINEFITSMEASDSGADLDNIVSLTLKGLDTALDNVLTRRAAAGSGLREIDALQQIGEDTAIQYQQSLSRLQDLDFAQAISDMMRQQVLLEAAQQSFARITNLSLFNVI